MKKIKQKKAEKTMPKKGDDLEQITARDAMEHHKNTTAIYTEIAFIHHSTKSNDLEGMFEETPIELGESFGVHPTFRTNKIFENLKQDDYLYIAKNNTEYRVIEWEVTAGITLLKLKKA